MFLLVVPHLCFQISKLQYLPFPLLNSLQPENFDYKM